MPLSRGGHEPGLFSEQARLALTMNLAARPPWPQRVGTVPCEDNHE